MTFTTTTGARGPMSADTDPGTASSVISLRILEALVEAGEPAQLTQVADSLGLPKARVHRHLNTLRAAGYVRQSGRSRRYEPDWRFSLLARKASNHALLGGAVQQIARDLRDQVEQTVVFSQATDHGTVVMNVEPGNAMVDIVFPPGTQFGWNASAQGKVALAFGSERQIALWRQSTPEIRTEYTRQSIDEVLAGADEIRERGWVSAPNETYLGINAVAAPVLDSNREIYGTLALVASVHFLPDPPDPDAVAALVASAATLSADLGYEPEPTDDDSQHSNSQE